MKRLAFMKVYGLSFSARTAIPDGSGHVCRLPPAGLPTIGSAPARWPHDPEGGFRIISKVIPAALKTEKNREGYKKVPEALKMASGDKMFKVPVEELVSELYERRPPLPALRDELRKAG
ncbi:MAG TPA: hypothetical protein VFX43_11965 [Chitinophagaceae bacterium]|nr:hypothetical protein [Chitinophagaceae bacterium]